MIARLLRLATGALPVALALSMLPPTSARAADGVIPDQSYASELLFEAVSPAMSARHHNQPAVINGYLLLAGNASFELWDISDPFAPRQLSFFQSPYRFGEAESHAVSFLREADGTLRAATISGRGIDLWDITDATAPVLTASMLLEGISYGDNTEAVWGVHWQGRYVYVGGTNIGLFVVDASDPTSPTLVTRLPSADLGGVSAGPLFAIGNLLVVTTPKNFGGIATLDISDPARPMLLDSVLPPSSYIGWFYGRHAHLLDPFRTYDVTTDPSNIELVASFATPDSEYMSFGDGHLFLGNLRPLPGVTKYDITDPADPIRIGRIPGRSGRGVDDQFSVPIGNLLVLSDDERNIGSILTVHDTQRDTVPPAVAYVNPVDGATGLSLESRIGLSFTDPIELTSVDASTLIVRPVGGAPLAGSWGLASTVLSFWPDAPLAPDTTYEIVLPAGGITDLVGNGIASTFRSTFSTGTDIGLPPCSIEPTDPILAGGTAGFGATSAGPGAVYEWDFGDGATSGPTATPSAFHRYAEAGRYRVTLAVATDGGTSGCASTQIVHLPLTARAPTRAGSILVDDERGRTWVVNPDADTVTAIDATSLEKLFEVPVGTDPRTIAQGPDGRIWVANHDSADVAILSPDDGAELGRVALPRGSQPHGIVFGPDGGGPYLTLEGLGEVRDLGAGGWRGGRALSLGAGGGLPTPSVRGIAVDAAGKRLFVTRFVSPQDRGEVYEIRAEDLSLTRVIPLAHDPGPDASDAGRGVPNYLSTITISPDGTRAWIPSKKDNTERGLNRDGLPLTPINAVRTIVSAVDLGTSEELLDARVDLDDHDMAYVVEASPLGDLIFVASQGTNQVDVLDAVTGAAVAGFSTGLAPQGLALDASGRLWVQSFMSRSVNVFDVSGILDGSDTLAPELADIATVANEKLTPRVLLGKQIFYNADTPRMNQDGYLSCASCHLDGGSDERVWDFTDRGEGFRNTITLLGRAGTGHGPVHWTGNFDEIQDFENDIRLHFGGGGLLSDADFEAGTRSDPLGDPKAGLSDDLDALAAYVSSLDEVPPSPYRQADGSLSPEALAGRALFESLDCAGCHGGSELTDSALDVLHDVGTIKATSGFRLGGPLTGLDTPTLEGVWATAPYLHDGSAATLHDVIANPEHGNAAALSPEDRDRLVAYLLSLDDTFEARRLEAEAGALSGGVAVASEHAGFSGSGYADFPERGDDGTAVTWARVLAPEPGLRHDLEVRYANGSTTRRRLALRIDGETVGTPLSFPPTGGWASWNTVSASVVLPEGVASIALVSTGGAGPNVDFVELRSNPPACGLGAELPLLFALGTLARRRRARR